MHGEVSKYVGKVKKNRVTHKQKLLVSLECDHCWSTGLQQPCAVSSDIDNTPATCTRRVRLSQLRPPCWLYPVGRVRWELSVLGSSVRGNTYLTVALYC